MKLQDRFKAMDSDFIKFERIPEGERLHPSRRLCAFLKVADLMKDPAKFSVHAEHDILYLADEDELRDLTDADVLYLVRCGVCVDTECGSLACLGTATKSRPTL